MAVERNYAPKRLLVSMRGTARGSFLTSPVMFLFTSCWAGKGLHQRLKWGAGGWSVTCRWYSAEKRFFLPSMLQCKKLHLSARLGGRCHSEAETLPTRPPCLHVSIVTSITAWAQHYKGLLYLWIQHLCLCVTWWKQTVQLHLQPLHLCVLL